MDPDFEESIDASYVFVDPTVVLEELLPEDVVTLVTKPGYSAGDGAPSCSIAVWARCIGYIGFGTSLLSLGLLLLVPHFVLAANQLPAEPGRPQARRQRCSTIAGIERRRRSPSLPVGQPRRAVTLPQHHTTKSCLEKIPIPPGRRVTFVDHNFPRSIVASMEPPAELADEIQVYAPCDDGSSTSGSSVTSSSMSTPSMAIFGASSLPSTPSPTSTEHLPLTIPETEHVLGDLSPKRRRTLADKIPRVTKLFSGWRKHGISSLPSSPAGSDDTAWSPKHPKPFTLSSHRRRTGSPSVSVGSSPTASPVDYFSPLPSPSVSIESKQSYFRRRSSDRRRTPVTRTEPYGAPYFAAPPTSPPPRAPIRRRSRSLTRRSEDIRLSSEREHRPPIQRVITKRRSASADCIIRKSLRV